MEIAEAAADQGPGHPTGSANNLGVHRSTQIATRVNTYSVPPFHSNILNCRKDGACSLLPARPWVGREAFDDRSSECWRRRGFYW